MKYLTACLLLLFVFTVHSEEMPIVRMQTNLGTIVLELNPSAAPKTVNNFLRYALDGFYEGTIFHRVIRYFIIQGGGYTPDHEKKPPTYAPIPNESNKGLKNERYSIAMARNAHEHDSATSQFFINVKDNPSLNYGGSMYSDWGYAVFGRVIEGMDVVNKIKKLKTGSSAPFRKYVPESPVIIEKVFVENAPPLMYDAPVSAEPTAEAEPETQAEIQAKIQPEPLWAEPETRAETSLAEPKHQAKVSLQKKPQKVVVQTPISSLPEIFLLAPDPPSVSDKQEPLAD